MFGIGIPEIIIIAVVGGIILAPIVLIIVSLVPPKTPNKGTFIAIFLGPLAYIYVSKWGKSIGLFVLGWLTGGLLHLIIWPYSIFNIRTDIRHYNEEQEINEARLKEVRQNKE